MFNTAIEYDTDSDHRALSRAKHYIAGDEAYSYEYDAAGNIKKLTNPDGTWVEYTYDARGRLRAPPVAGGASKKEWQQQGD